MANFLRYKLDDAVLCTIYGTCNANDLSASEGKHKCQKVNLVNISKQKSHEKYKNLIQIVLIFFLYFVEILRALKMLVYIKGWRGQRRGEDISTSGTFRLFTLISKH